MKWIEQIRERSSEYPPYYEAPSGSFLRLDQNANLGAPSPVLSSFRPSVAGLHLYPNRDNRPLIEAAAEAFHVDPRSVFVGNGSDEVLDTVLRFLVAPGGRVASFQPSYSMYPHLCRANRLRLVPIPLGPGFEADVDAIADSGADLALVANPNNPTGTVVPSKDLERLLKRFPGPVLVDEAYADFADASMLPRLARHDNLIVARTLSKAAGLAGLRVGLGFAHPDAAELLRRAKLPFAVNLLSEQYAVAALRDPEAMRGVARATAAERSWLQRELAKRGFKVVPSQANFLLTLPPLPAAQLHERLRSEGILARVFPHEPSLAAHIRFTVATRTDHERLLSALDRIRGATR